MIEAPTTLAVLIALPLAWAAVAFLLGPTRGASVGIAGVATQVLLALHLGADVAANGPAGHPVGGWGGPLGIELVADGLTVTLLLLAQLVALPVVVYARAYFAAPADTQPYFWPLAGFLMAGLNALFLSADLFNVYVALELIGLAAVALVAGGGAAQFAAALRYLFASVTGSAAYLLGMALIYGTYGTVAMDALVTLIRADAPRIVWLAGGLMATGLMVKTALFPFHYWLPPAHAAATPPVSALLSAIVVKASFYLILRLWLGPFADLVALAGLVSWIPAVLGGAAMLWGSYEAIRASDLKMLVAYSTVAQIGYLFLIVPLLGHPGALQAGVMQACAHGIAKAGMFAAAGVLVRASGRLTVDGLAGTAAQLPVALFAFALAGVTLMGLPPSSGFLAKWLLLKAALAQGYWPIAAVTLGGGLLAAVYVFRVLRFSFTASVNRAQFHTVPRTLEWTALLLSGASVALGLRGIELLSLLSIVERP